MYLDPFALIFGAALVVAGALFLTYILKKPRG